LESNPISEKKSELSATNHFDPAIVRKQFPILNRQVHGKELIYLDSAASSQKPQQVIDCINHYYSNTHSNVHRGAHKLAAEATEAFEAARSWIADYVGAENQEVNFTKGTTDSINLVASGYSQKLKPGDQIMIGAMEHHSNIVPWQMACERSGAELVVIPNRTDDGNWTAELDWDFFTKHLSDKVKVLAMGWISNSMGTVHPVKQYIEKAHEFGAVVLLDGAQAAPHRRINVRELDCDFLAFSAHKAYGPTGMGALYGKTELLESLPPYQGGGEMISDVSFEKTTYNKLPYKFEAGTPNIAGAIAMAEGLRFIDQLNVDTVEQYESDLLSYGEGLLDQISGIRRYSIAPQRASVMSFLAEGVHPYDLGVLLDQQGIAVRTGHHCCQPLMSSLGIEGTVRASLGVYNTKEDLDTFARALERALGMLR
jgi:cysteine desulfurase/selenocysteine lyase